jgi:hypothetical protein
VKIANSPWSAASLARPIWRGAALARGKEILQLS